MARSSKDIQLSELKDMISQLNMTIKTLNDTIAGQQSENDNLKAELTWFRQKMFGSSSERRMDEMADQLSLFESLPEEEKHIYFTGNTDYAFLCTDRNRTSCSSPPP